MNKAALSSSSFSPLPPTYPCSRISQPILLTPRVFPLPPSPFPPWRIHIVPSSPAYTQSWGSTDIGKLLPSPLPPGRKIPSTRHASFFLSFLHDVIPWADPQFHSGLSGCLTCPHHHPTPLPLQAPQHFNPIQSDLHGFLSFSTYRYISD